MSCVRFMIALLVVLWGVIAVEAMRRTQSPPPASELISPSAVQAEALDLSAILNRPVGDIVLKDVELDAALQAIGRRAKVGIAVSWRQIEKNFAVTPRTRLSLSLYDVSLETAIQGILQSVKGHLCFGIASDGTIVVTSDAALATEDPIKSFDGRTYTDTPKMIVGYDIRDIVPNPPPPPLPPPAPPVTTPGGGLFRQLDHSHNVSVAQITLLDIFKQQMPLVPMHRERGWEVLDGLYAGRLIVAQIPENHRRLREILRQIRLQNPRGTSKGKTP